MPAEAAGRHRITLAAVASDIMGVSGRAMLEALIARERDPQALAEPATVNSRPATRIPCTPVRDLIGVGDTRAAYAVQQRVTAARLERGARVVGHKIGLTSSAVQRQLSVDRPDFGAPAAQRRTSTVTSPPRPGTTRS